MIERSHLSILREVDERGSLTAAAEALNLTQSALSHTIKKLETRIGTPLWTREGRKLQLTQAGDFLLKEARRVLPQLERVDEVLLEYAEGDRGTLRIGMECYPCYQWLLTIVGDFLHQWPGVDVDVRQQFQFGGMAALYNHDIDLLITPDPVHRKGIVFTPVFDYEQVLVVGSQHEFSTKKFVVPEDLTRQTLYTYPVEKERLDIYKLFLLPAGCMPKKHKTIEATEIMLQLVAAGRGVAALPRWLVAQFETQMPVITIGLGRKGISKQIHLGMRQNEEPDSFAQALLKLAVRRARKET